MGLAGTLKREVVNQLPPLPLSLPLRYPALLPPLSPLPNACRQIALGLSRLPPASGGRLARLLEQQEGRLTSVLLDDTSYAAFLPPLDRFVQKVVIKGGTDWGCPNECATSAWWLANRPACCLPARLPAHTSMVSMQPFYLTSAWRAPAGSLCSVAACGTWWPVLLERLRSGQPTTPGVQCDSSTGDGVLETKFSCAVHACWHGSTGMGRQPGN